ncbi:stage V sporulation protein AB [[Clostridium] polysaccharolyticum]|uniref:stage V sporulation protein AB n=1 Tax=[Clostridium] polysaccharolyticum TaxID=29364 RepID=UPI0015A584C6|nr:stage V sporulation protein AB [[Clostridium] polysaccharolyticum]
MAKLGVIPRLLARTNTAKYTPLYEKGIIIGGSLGNLYSLFQFRMPIGIAAITIICLFFGIYIGCLAMAIAETLNVIPYFISKSKLKLGISGIIIALALGKGCGTLLQLFFH